ncbi:TonB-dependent receptor [Camelimonas abortus]|uniref:TonB-dependent receptor n=1 Tax=Camelimonas abortus TaxID=1017184 RepID=A0ABV7LB28_9HYPH
MNPERVSMSLRPLMSGLALTTGVVAGLTAAAEAQTRDQGAADAAGSGGGSAEVALDTITVQGAGAGSGNANNASLGVSRMPEPLRQTPKTVNVVSQQLIEQQQATTLEQALRNVPGITLSTGEGNGGVNGDSFRIRGISAKGDIYVDGLRDFGAYVRDTFDTESVEVIKGPSGEGFGIGNQGGLINQTSKRAKLSNFFTVEQGVGTGFLSRTTVDGNYRIGETTAVRVNGVYHHQDVADRDHVKNRRSGFALDFATGIGSPTEWRLNYRYQHNDNVPDMGVPLVRGHDGLFRPVTEFGVPRNTSYVRSTDRDRGDIHAVTSNLKHQVNDWLTITNDTRYTWFYRDWSATNPAACIDDATATPQVWCRRDFFRGLNPKLAYGAGGGMTYRQYGWAIQDVLTARADFNVGGFRNRLVMGVDASYQDDERKLGAWTGRLNDQTIYNPRYAYPGAFATYGATRRLANSSNVGLFANDRLWLTETLSVQGAVRWDYFRSKFTNAPYTFGGTATSYKTSPSVAVIWEPLPNATVYASFSRAYRPVGADIAVAVGGVASEVPQSGANLEPERSDVYEIGSKVDVLDGRLGLTAAAFNIDKKNSFTFDPATGEIVSGFSEAGQGRRVQGVELGASGRITENWSVNAAYAWLHGKVTRTVDGTAGNEAPATPRNNVSLWTSYDLTQEVTKIPGVITIGGGLLYASSYWADNANTARIPQTFSLDAMVAWKYENLRVAVNAYNLTDRVNYASAFNAARAVPASGRTVLLSVSATFSSF